MDSIKQQLEDEKDLTRTLKRKHVNNVKVCHHLIIAPSISLVRGEVITTGIEINIILLAQAISLNAKGILRYSINSYNLLFVSLFGIVNVNVLL